MSGRSGVLFVALLLGLPGIARAQQRVPDGKFSANRFVPAIGGGNYVQVDGALLGGHLTPSAEIILDYAHRPFVLYDASCPGGNTDECTLEDSEVEIVKYQLTTSLAGTLTLFQRLQLGAIVPLVFTTGDSYRKSTGAAFSQPYVDIRGGDAFALGDTRLSAKVRLAGKGTEGFMLAALAFMTLPLGNATAEGRSVGDDGLTGGGHLAAEYRIGRVRGGANLGANIRPSRTLLATESGPEMYYGIAGGFDITSLLAVVGEFAGATRFTAELDENPMEWRVAGQLKQGDFVFSLGGGVGLVSGVGVPNFRLVGGAAFQPAGLDSDNDGVGDNTDACPAELEDKDGYLDDDGCPDGDNDGDGIEDLKDKCPDDAEDPDGHEDQDGCPDRDNDADGIQDGYDSCPDQPEDKDGDRDEDGCPDNDRDRDGVEDDKDKCPDQPEDTDGYGDDDGCPETDFDADTILDDQDQCPDEPETVNGVDDEDGCPDEGAAAAPEASPP